jgi:proline racemase
MKIERMITTVDSHTGGTATRVITGGLPPIPGKTMLEKKIYMKEEMDHIRTMLVQEPRGHHTMVAAVLTSPTVPEADFGLFFADPSGYQNMCGHGTIGVATTLVETAMVPVQEPTTQITLETPIGLINARVSVEDGLARSVTFRNQPAFLYKRDLEVGVKDLGRLAVDLSYGGNWYAILPASEVGLEIRPENINAILLKGNRIKDAVGQIVSLEHPETGLPGILDSVMFTGPSTHPEADGKNVVISFFQGFDRSPCGTGTSARMAALYARGQLKRDDPFVHEGILGTIFWGKIVGETRIGEFPAIIPEITGSAYITGIHQFVATRNDPLKDGFLVGF